MPTQQKIRIGLPRALLYHKYATKWKCFFEALGCQVVTSPKTNRLMLEYGTRSAIDENCLAVKVYLGHVHYLINRVDYIFIPRIVSIHRDETLCVKMYALADIVRNTFDQVQLLECNIDVERGKHEFPAMFRLAQKLTHNPLKIIMAYCRACLAFKRHQEAQIQEQDDRLFQQSESTCRVLLVAHSYITQDALLGAPVVKMLKDQQVDVVYADLIEEDSARRQSRQISEDLYWTYNRELLGAIAQYRGQVDGILFLMAFPCGPDALVIHLCQNMISGVPVVVIVLDEQLGDAGLRTRIESFVDILRFKKEKTS